MYLAKGTQQVFANAAKWFHRMHSQHSTIKSKNNPNQTKIYFCFAFSTANTNANFATNKNTKAPWEAALAPNKPRLVLDKFPNIHRFGSTAKAQASQKKFFHFNRSATVRVQQLEKGPRVPNIEAQSFKIFSDSLRIYFLFKHSKCNATGFFSAHLAEQSAQLLQVRFFVVQHILHHGCVVFLRALNCTLAKYGSYDI